MKHSSIPDYEIKIKTVSIFRHHKGSIPKITKYLCSKGAVIRFCYCIHIKDSKHTIRHIIYISLF